MLELQRRLERDDVAYWVLQADGNSWYPGRFMESPEALEPWLQWSLDAVDAAIASARAEGFDLSRIVLVGFSQGGCLIAEHLVRNPARYGAVALLTGALIGPLDAGREVADLDGLPVFLGTARGDEWVPLEFVQATVEVLDRAGAATSVEIYEDTEHQINDAEVARLRDLIDGLAAAS
jgi:phospholipase/carboxylesterase